MSLYIDVKFLNMISVRLERFVRKNDYLWNFRCPVCGDSHKNKLKARAYAYQKKGGLFMKCHNCGVGMSMGNLIKTMDASLHKEYVLERYKAGENGSSNYEKPVFNVPSPRFDTLAKKTYENAEYCDKLPDAHFCIQYLKGRDIPKDKWDRLLYTDHYKDFCNEINPNHSKTIDNDKRLVIPYYSEYGELIAVSGRALETSSEKLRYVTVRMDNGNDHLIYGLDTVDLSKKVYIVEGPLDSLFINNSVASGGTALTQVADKISAMEKVLVFDNEPRNKEVVKIVKKSIDSSFDVVVWPDYIKGKDINEMIQLGMSPDDVLKVIDQNTFTGLEAQMKYTLWKKV